MKKPTVLLSWLDKHRRLLTAVQALARRRGVELFLVGGCLRDICIRQDKRVDGAAPAKVDIDLCLKRGALSFGRALARQLKAGFVVLDEKNRCSRVVIKQPAAAAGSPSMITLDFADFRGPSLKDDLGLRDFTVNSLALPLGQALVCADPDELLIDPGKAKNDIRAGRLRLCYAGAFVDDPLRILRAFSLSSSCGFSLDARVLSAAKKHVRRLSAVSAERIRDELFKIFSCGKSYKQVRAMDTAGALVQVLPELSALKRLKRTGRNAFDMWKHTLAVLDSLEKLLPEVISDRRVSDYLAAEVCSGRSRLALLKTAALLHDAGKPKTFAMRKGKVTFYGHERVGAEMVRAAAERLKLSTPETRSLRRLTFMHLRPGYLASLKQVSPRARFRFFRDAGDDALSLIILALADQRGTSDYAALEPIRPRYERLMRSLIKEYLSKQEQPARKRLVDGNLLMRRFSLRPGPLIGSVLAQLDELQALGKITTTEEALKRAAGLIERQGNKPKGARPCCL